MESRKLALNETKIIAIGELVGVAVMFAVFALLHRFDMRVLLGGMIGGVLSVANFFAIAMVATLAADRAEQQDVQGGTNLIRGSYPVRMLALGAILFLCAWSGYVHVVALVIPLLFVRPIILISEFFRKKGD